LHALDLVVYQGRQQYTERLFIKELETEINILAQQGINLKRIRYLQMRIRADITVKQNGREWGEGVVYDSIEMIDTGIRAVGVLLKGPNHVVTPRANQTMTIDCL
jgi:hypothetical protein